MPSPSSSRRRLAAGAAALVMIGAGLFVSTALPDTFATDAAGDILYAALIYLLVVIVAPGLRPITAGAIALAWCIAVELFQLTGLPDAWGSAFAPLMLVFGTVFAPEDLLMYAIGVVAAAAVDLVLGALASHRLRRDSGVSPAREETR